MSSRFKSDVLICVAERGEEVHIPDGNFALKAGDDITIVAASAKIAAFFKKIGVPTMRAKDAMVIGGGGTSYYLATLLLDMGVKVKIVDKSRARCEELCELVPNAMVICGDGTERDLLLEEGLAKAESVVSMMDFDEENIMLSL